MSKHLTMTKAMTLAELALAATLVVGCADPVATEGRSCPCAAGNVCCANNKCARDQAACATAINRDRLDQARGEWNGYIENLGGMRLSDRIQLSFEIQTDGALSGRVIFGAAPPPPPPTNPDQAWPEASFDGSYKHRQLPIEGVAYPAQQIRWDEARLRFSLPVHFPWQTWCGLQISYPIDAAGELYACLPNGGAMGTPDGTCVLDVLPAPLVVPCGKLEMCRPDYVCRCSKDGCVANLDESFPIDIALRDGIGDGSILLGGQLHNLRVTRAP